MLYLNNNLDLFKKNLKKSAEVSMKQMKPQLSSFNVFSFKTEAEMIVWIKFWEKHADDYFKDFRHLVF